MSSNFLLWAFWFIWFTYAEAQIKLSLVLTVFITNLKHLLVTFDWIMFISWGSRKYLSGRKVCKYDFISPQRLKVLSGSLQQKINEKILLFIVIYYLNPGVPRNQLTAVLNRGPANRVVKFHLHYCSCWSGFHSQELSSYISNMTSIIHLLTHVWPFIPSLNPLLYHFLINPTSTIVSTDHSTLTI